MKRYKITFWYKPLPQENMFIKDNEDFLTNALITENKNIDIDTFHVKLLDIGLDSKYGEFELTRKKGLWQTYDIDGNELNFLKTNISWTLEFYNK